MYAIDRPGMKMAQKGQAVWKTRDEAEAHLAIAAEGMVLYRVMASWFYNTHEPQPPKGATWRILTVEAYMSEYRGFYEFEFHEPDSNSESVEGN